jgi:hypothetical protein
MHTGTGHMYDQLNTKDLLDEINCLLDATELEVQLEDYVAAETAIIGIIDRAQSLQQLLHLIPLRSETTHTNRDEDNEVEALINLERTSRRIADDAHNIRSEIDKYMENHPLTLANNIALRYDVKAAFCLKNSKVLVHKDFSLASDERDSVYMKINDTRFQPEEPSTFIFEQLSKCTLPPLWVDDLLSIDTIDFEMTITIKKSYKTENR